ncbi:MAG: PrsW family glutamic-type intramembrane protease [Oscillatoria sp. PMC 1068.18]|nr:PrsW family glutamic-type intramembrane protease [Oscillatoria sp. PMC 1076.18]MEC4988967.1 PrsW family glutamic-type intramembrane protease [Oscillatoria sp. PMC 1068.18]
MSGLLRQLPNGGKSEVLLPPYTLSPTHEITIGRDPRCDLALDANRYKGVSRRHVTINQQADGIWQICDLSSANGTYVNGERLYGCHNLSSGDRVQLAGDGPVFVFELQTNPARAQTAAISSPATQVTSSATPLRQPDSVTFTQLFPIISTGRDLTKKAFLVPAIFTVVFVVLMFAFVGNPDVFNFLLAAYISGAAYFYIYQLCGKHKPWWVLIAATMSTVAILLSPLLILFIVVFREILPGNLPTEGETVSFASLLIRMFFGAGLMEELLKAIPIAIAFFLGKAGGSRWISRIGVNEPLDGILLGTASAVGFTLLETLGQYVPGIINQVTLQAGESLGELVGIHLLIPRILGSVAGHMAYSGYLGYFIGLCALKPRKSWQILAVGYLSASLLHALWNASGYYSNLLLALVGVMSYAFLAAAILKARAISPTREQNFATRLSSRP